MNLLICCKASAEIGLGHLTRSYAFVCRIMEQWPDTRVFFWLIGDPKLLPASLGPNTVLQHFSIEDEVKYVPEVDVLVLDMIQLKEDLLEKLKEKVKLSVVLSPIFEHFDKVDILFARTQYLDGTVRECPSLKVYAGLEYAVVQENCKQIGAGVYEENLQQKSFPIAISMGGGDAANKTLWVLHELRACSVHATFWVMLGEGYRHSFDRLIEETREDRRHEVILARTNRSMWHILKNCVLAILPGGITTYEAVYAGLPTINLFENENQQFLVKELEEHEALFNLGLFSSESLKKVSELLENFDTDRKQLLRMHVNTKWLIDGKGPERIFQTIQSHL